MDQPKRATIYFAPELHKALRLRAAAADRSISDMVNDAVRTALEEDAEDLASFGLRVNEKTTAYEVFVADLKRRDRL